MSPEVESAEPKVSLKTKLFDHLYNPNKLRAIVTGVMLAIGYVGVYMPLSSGMDTTNRNLNKERKRLELGCEVEQLQTQYNRFKNRIPKQRDANEWVPYVLDGVRKFPLTLLKWNGDELRDVGPYKVVVLRLDLEGTFTGMDAMLDWLETNERLIRVDTVKIAPQKAGSGKLVMTLVVLGVMG
jgi:hypothetical protein